MYNFDLVVDRKNTNCLKYDFSVERGRPKDILPFWVADMDFTVPKEVLDGINNVTKHGIFGYSDVKSDYFEAVSNWLFQGFGYKCKSDWLIKTPGVVFALAMAVRAFTNVGDGCMILSPVYYPFTEVIEVNERKLVESNLVLKNGRYEIDFEDVKNKIVENNVKILLFCSPHNPVGRVWTREELTTLGQLCLDLNVLVVSDEIHMDFVYDGHKHTIFPSINEKFAENSILLTAPSKTFNIAGLQVSNVFIKNPDIFNKFKREIDKTGYSQLNIMGLVACQQAYTHGKPWLDQLRKYLQGNLDFLREYIKKNLPQVTLIEPDGTYLVWLDFSKMGNSDYVNDIITNKALVWLDPGEMFGESGRGYQRINIGCPKAIIEEGLGRIKEAFK